MHPYEAAVAAHQILQHGGRLAEPSERLADAWADDPRRLILAHMAEWWELRDDMRVRIEDEVRAFSRLWATRGEAGLRAEWSHWGNWEHPYGRPFAGDEGTNALPGHRKLIQWRRVDLQEVGDVDAGRLDLQWCTLDSLDGIERFTELRSLRLLDVRGLEDVRAIERLPELRLLHISSDDPGVTHAVTELDMTRFPEIRTVYLKCFSSTGERVRLDTRWIARARWLRRLDLGEFVPARGSYADVAAASRLTHLSVMRMAGAGAERLSDELPLTSVYLRHPLTLDDDE